MNAAHWHLLLNHIPVLLTPVGLVILLLALRRGSDELRRLALGTFVAAALFGTPAYLTGEDASMWLPPDAEDWEITEPFVEAHEDFAMIAFTGLVILGTGSLIAMIAWRGGRAMPKWCTSVALAAALIVSGLLAQTAHLGGQVRHTEIRPEPANSEAEKKAG